MRRAIIVAVIVVLGLAAVTSTVIKGAKRCEAAGFNAQTCPLMVYRGWDRS